MKRFFDTCSLLTDCSDLSDVLISSVSIQELEDIKCSAHKSDETKYKARIAVRAIKEQNPEIVIATPNDYSDIQSKGVEINNDSLIVACASRSGDIEFYTEDVLCGIFAEKIWGLTVKSLTSDKTDKIYTGYISVTATEEELSAIYSKDNCENIFGCLVNQYVIINDNENNFCDVLRWTGDRYVSIWNKAFKSRQLGTCKPLDVYQRMAFDAVANNDVTVLFGKAGSGKTTIPMSFIMQSLESGKYKKCFMIFSYDTLKGQNTLGYVKGDDLTKQLHTGSLGGILATKFGDITEAERLIASNLIEIVPTANLRGVEFGEDSIVFCTEAQNLDLYALKTLIQRCKTGSKLLLEGDVLEQCDSSRGVGLFKMIDVFKNNSCFGCVKLKNNYRSEISNLADLL